MSFVADFGKSQGTVGGGVRGVARGWLPTGHSLAPELWAGRHRWITIVLWCHVVGVAVFAMLRGEALLHGLIESAAIGALAIGASHTGLGRAARAGFATAGLVVSSAVLVHLSDGLIEMHFHFFVVIVIVSLYQAWTPFLLALVLVVLHHGIAGTEGLPTTVFNHPAALAHPWRWALFHGAFILAESVACLVAWRSNEQASERERTALRALTKVNGALVDAQMVAKLGSWTWEPASGAVKWSEELFRITGNNPEDFTPTSASFVEAVHPDHRARVSAIIDSAAAIGSVLDYECTIVRPDGTTAVIHARGHSSTEPNSSPRIVGTVQDITERKALEREIEHRAFHDTLTGLGNRALFNDRLGHALAVRERSGSPLYVLFLDLDDFKPVNDTLGHDVGDAVLAEVARRLLEAVRTGDTVARLGGDEFAVVVEDAAIDEALHVAQRIKAAMRAPMSIDRYEVVIGTSIGIAIGDGATAASEVLRDADMAMYAAKTEGKGHLRVFTAEMRSAMASRMQLGEELRDALDLGQFVVHYQPIVDQETGEVEAVEALVRWDHPERGLLSTADFLALAEESGVIIPLGTWVINEATRQVQALGESLDIPLGVNINISPQQLGLDLVDVVHRALAASTLDPEDLVLEFDESCVRSGDEAVMDEFRLLRASGAHVAIHNFGNAYASWDYLRRLPIDMLKIDRNFINRVTDGSEESNSTSAIIRLARSLDLRTIAEGVESAEQAAALRGYGCQSAQGYYLSRPLDARELVEHLRDRSTRRGRI